MTAATRSLVAAQDGDPDGFTRFVELTTGDVTRYCRYLGNADHVDDLVQDTYLRALRSLHTYRGDTDGRRWLLAIARRACADSIEHGRRSRRTEPTRRPVHDHATTTALELLLEDLPTDQRTAFVLTQLLGYTYDEAARHSNCPTGTIRSRVARARASLVASLDHDDHARSLG